MLIAPQAPSDTCTHERRPGTTVCLHCRHAARIAAREKRKRFLLRGGAAAIVLGVVGAAGLLGADALQRHREAGRAPAPASIVVASTQPAAQPATPPVVADSSMSPVVQQGDATRHPTAAVPPLAPVIPQGQTDLPEGVVALRVDSTVTLSFDTPDARTRMPDKFERLVRRTLPEVYGPTADSLLATVPSGSLASQGNLLYELPARGMKIPLNDTWTLALFPETRPGQDGPLVIRYRVSVVPRS